MVGTYREHVSEFFKLHKGMPAKEIMALAAKSWSSGKKTGKKTSGRGVSNSDDDDMEYRGSGLPNNINSVDFTKYGGAAGQSGGAVKLLSKKYNARPRQLGAETEMPSRDLTYLNSPMAKLKLEKIERPENVGDSSIERQMFGGTRKIVNTMNPRNIVLSGGGFNDMRGAGWWDDVSDWVSGAASSVSNWATDNADWLVPTASALLL